MMRFVDPKNDVAFKKIFSDVQHKEILISFLNAVLDLKGPQQIADVQILNPYQAPKLEYLKYTLLDILATDNRGRSFIVEMQVEAVEEYKKRFQYYVAKAYSGQLASGQGYAKLNPVIFIGILDFKAFKCEKYLSRHLTLNAETYDHELEDFELYFIELPKFKKKESELTTLLDKWVYFIKHAPNLQIVPQNADTVGLKAAYEVAERLRWSKDDLEVYDYWAMKRQDEIGAITYAEKRGYETGHDEGHKEGHDEGLKKGEKAGRIATARSLLADGMDAARVARHSGLSVEEVTELSTQPEKSE